MPKRRKLPPKLPRRDPKTGRFLPKANKPLKRATPPKRKPRPKKPTDKNSKFVKGLVREQKANARLKRNHEREEAKKRFKLENLWQRRDPKGRFVKLPKRKSLVHKRTSPQKANKVRKLVDNFKVPPPDNHETRAAWARRDGKPNHRYDWEFHGAKSLPLVESLLEAIAVKAVERTDILDQFELFALLPGNVEIAAGSKIQAPQMTLAEFRNLDARQSLKNIVEQGKGNLLITVFAYSHHPVSW